VISRKDFLRAIPLAALAPEVLADGVHRYNLEPAGHFIFFVDSSKIDLESFTQMGNEIVPLMPKGSKGGWIVPVWGDVENAIKIFRLNDVAAANVSEKAIEIKNG